MNISNGALHWGTDQHDIKLMMVKLALEGTGKRIHLVIGFDMELYATTS